MACLRENSGLAVARDLCHYPAKAVLRVSLKFSALDINFPRYVSHNRLEYLPLGRKIQSETQSRYFFRHRA